MTERVAPRILIVEDDEQQRDLFARILMDAGYDVVSARNGDDAVLSAARDLPGMVLMDANMPQKSGWAATREIRADDRTKHIPVVMLTGFANEKAELAAEEAGCDAYITKPVPVRELLRVVARFLPLP